MHQNCDVVISMEEDKKDIEAMSKAFLLIMEHILNAWLADEAKIRKARGMTDMSLYNEYKNILDNLNEKSRSDLQDCLGFFDQSTIFVAKIWNRFPEYKDDLKELFMKSIQNGVDPKTTMARGAFDKRKGPELTQLASLMFEYNDCWGDKYVRTAWERILRE
jgi:hypothetical protein